MCVGVGLIIEACVKRIVPVWNEFNSLTISGWAYEYGNEPLVPRNAKLLSASQKYSAPWSKFVLYIVVFLCNFMKKEHFLNTS